MIFWGRPASSMASAHQRAILVFTASSALRTCRRLPLSAGNAVCPNRPRPRRGRPLRENPALAGGVFVSQPGPTTLPGLGGVLCPALHPGKHFAR